MKEKRKLSDINSIIDMSQGISLDDFREKLKSPDFREKLESHVNWALSNRKQIFKEMSQEGELLTPKKETMTIKDERFLKDYSCFNDIEEKLNEPLLSALLKVLRKHNRINHDEAIATLKALIMVTYELKYDWEAAELNKQ